MAEFGEISSKSSAHHLTRLLHQSANGLDAILPPYSSPSDAPTPGCDRLMDNRATMRVSVWQSSRSPAVPSAMIRVPPPATVRRIVRADDSETVISHGMRGADGRRPRQSIGGPPTGHRCDDADCSHRSSCGETANTPRPSVLAPRSSNRFASRSRSKRLISS